MACRKTSAITLHRGAGYGEGNVRPVRRGVVVIPPPARTSLARERVLGGGGVPCVHVQHGVGL